jgi:hypothetical protein
MKRITALLLLLMGLTVLVKAQTDVPIFTLNGHSYTTNCVRFSNDGKFLASGGGDNKLIIWDMKTGSQVLGFKGATYGGINSIIFSQDDKKIALALEDKTIKLFDAQNGAEIKTFKGHDFKVLDVRFLMDGKTIVSASNDYTLKIWKPEADKATQTLKGHSLGVNSLSLSTDGKRLISSSIDKTIKIWNTETFTELLTLKGHKGTVYCAAMSGDGNTIASCDADNVVKIWESTTGRELKTIIPDKNITKNSLGLITTSSNGIRYVWLNHNGKTMVTGGEDRMIRIWDVANSKEVQKILASDKASIRYLSVSNDGKLIAAALDDNTLKVWATSASFSVKEDIKTYVEKKINEWQVKGKYETTQDYQKRVNEASRKKQIENFSQEAINAMAIKQFDPSKATTDYDADNQSFKITYENFAPLYLKVPLADAESFDKNFKRMQVLNPKFTLSEDAFGMIHSEFKDSATGKVFVYDSKDAVSFNSTQLNLSFEPIEINIAATENKDQSAKQQVNETKKTVTLGKPDVDVDIPVTKSKKENLFALIIGNEDYSSFQTGLNSEVNVDYAKNDALVFKEYLVKTIGVPEENINLKTNATLGQMKQGIAWLTKLAEVSNGNAELVVYYSGHGLPDEQTKEGYLMPVDISGTEVTSAIKVNDLYAALTKFSVKKASVFLDACFSGGARNAGLVAMKGVKVKAKEETISGNLIVFSSSTGEESSTVYRDKQHGLFTYYLLKKLQETKGEVDYKSLSTYIQDNVKLKSVLINNKVQTPQTNGSLSISEIWGSWKLK